MKIWLDDLRPAPWGYESARSVNEAKTLIREAERNGIEIEALDLDHDLGDFANQGGDAIKLLDWLAERETFYPVEIHTANPVGRANMESVLARYWGEEYWQKLDGNFRRKVCKILSHIVIHIIEGAILHRLQYS